MTVRTLDYTGRIPKELERTEAIQNASAERFSPLRAVAQNLTRRGLAEAKTELANQALLAFVECLYECDSDGTPANYDTQDYRILIPSPFGRYGGKLWGLRAKEQRTLNTILRQRCLAQSSPLFVYAGKQWLIGRDYNTRRVALAYLRQAPITLAEWRLAWSANTSAWSRRNLGDD